MTNEEQAIEYIDAALKELLAASEQESPFITWNVPYNKLVEAKHLIYSEMHGGGS